MTARTKSLDQSAAEIGCSTRWLADQIRARRFPARKIGKSWRMTDSDIAEALDIVKQVGRTVTPHKSGAQPVRPLSFTSTSARRLTA